jgi:hypothetical protein
MSISNRIRKCFSKLDWTGSPYEIAETEGGVNFAVLLYLNQARNVALSIAAE